MLLTFFPYRQHLDKELHTHTTVRVSRVNAVPSGVRPGSPPSPDLFIRPPSQRGGHPDSLRGLQEPQKQDMSRELLRQVWEVNGSLGKGQDAESVS